MKKKILVIGLLLSAVTIYAQKNVYIGTRGGLNIPKLTASGDNPMSKGYSSRLAGNGGIFAEFRFSNLFSIQPMLEYTQQGGIRDGMQAIPMEMLPESLHAIPQMVGGEYLYADFKSETTFDYLMLPVLAKVGYNLGETRVRLTASAGPFISFLLGAHQMTSGSSKFFVDPAADITLDNLLASIGASPLGELPIDHKRAITNDVNSINYGVSANVGLMYEVAPRHNLLFEVGGNYGFRQLQKNSQNGENRIGAATIVVGYAFQL